ncbi:MAG: nucleotidyltransferase family protein [Betaproteobacteria bacterium]
MIACILLAAGSASRFGSQKLLARLPDGRRMVEVSAANLFASGANNVVAVTRNDAELIQVLENCGCQVVINHRADEGMGTSIAAGVAASSAASGWLIVLGDMPSIRVETIMAVKSALDKGSRIVVPAKRGQRGHPVGFSAFYGIRLQALTGDTGAREILKTDATLVEEIGVDDAGIFADIDTPAELKR